MTTEKNHDLVVLIGPVLPFRGGIAQHSTMLRRALAERAELLTLSFVRQYPRLLFPGRSDRDPDYAGHREPGVEYLIDSLNPLSWIKALKRVLDAGPGRVIIPWWTVYWGPCIGFLARAMRRRGIEVVFFCHNIDDHEPAAWKRWLNAQVLAFGCGFVVHTRAAAAELMRRFPHRWVAVHPHPIYEQFPAASVAPVRRRALELLFYGFVRPYKGLDLLIEAMALLRDEDIQLTIAGEFWGGSRDTLREIERHQLADKIEVIACYQSEQETAALFMRADAVVLPYRSASGSGVVPIAYHYDRPVIATRVGGLPDVVEHGVTGYLVDPDDPALLAAAIQAMTRSRAQSMVAAIGRAKQGMSWDSLAAVCLKRY